MHYGAFLFGHVEKNSSYVITPDKQLAPVDQPGCLLKDVFPAKSNRKI